MTTSTSKPPLSCSKCETEITPDAAFCSNCGVALINRTPPTTQSSGFFKLLKWILFLSFLSILLIVGLVAFAFSEKGTLEKWKINAKAFIGVEISLPDCKSKVVESNLFKRYGPLTDLLASSFGAGLVENHTKEISFDEKQQLRSCSSEYKSLFGYGDVFYTIAWYDPKVPSVDALSVILDIKRSNLPEGITKALEAIETK